MPEDVLKLEGEAMNHVECIEDAYLVIEDGVITDFGPGTECNAIGNNPEIEYIDAEGGFVMPTFCDSHTHIVYAGCRDGEFRDKIAGLSYEEIAARGGGILNSADLLPDSCFIPNRLRNTPSISATFPSLLGFLELPRL